MINFEKFILSNGLRVIVHQDFSTPQLAMNILYDVGARDENPEKTGFAHLFEHLMFGGSVHIPSYDEVLQRAGGDNNAFTNNDITNYYLTLPSINKETGFWLESDRMLSLSFSEKSLEVQRNVVIEEYKQRYLNQPYGDIWLLLRPLVFKVHPYQWPTIGKEISHIENAKMEDVKSFFYKHYRPNNAILVLSGNIKTDEALRLTEKWFGPIDKGDFQKRNLPVEPKQNEKRTLRVERKVPYDTIYKVYHISKRNDPDYYAYDLLADVMGRGISARLHKELIKKQNLFSDINCFVTGEMDNGLFVVSGRLLKGTKINDAESAIDNEIEKLKNKVVGKDELQKVKNKAESTFEFSEMNILNKAMNLAYFELLGDAEMLNHENKKYQMVTADQMQALAQKTFVETNSTVLYYNAAN
jgi:predicted Zn-dependent peptidase